MADLIVIILFLSMAIVFFWLSIRTGQNISKENAIVGLYSVIFTAYCFMWSYTGFISAISEAFNQFPYYFLMMAGTETTFRVIKGQINQWKNEKNNTELNKKRMSVKKLQYIHVIITGFTMVITFLFIYLGKQTENNYFIMLPNVITPLYLGIMVVINILILKSYNSIYFKEMITSYYIVTFTVSLYELYDWYVYITGKYTLYGYYPDKTHGFDIYYILLNIIGLIFAPRIVYAIQDSKQAKNKADNK